MERFTKLEKREVGVDFTVFPPAFLSMYQISGQDKITSASFVRYLKDKNKEEDRIIDMVEKIPYFSIEEMELSPEEDKQIIFIKDCLNSDDPEVQLICLPIIRRLSDENKEDIKSLVLEKINNGLRSLDINLQIAAAKMLYYAQLKETRELSLEVLNNQDMDISVKVVVIRFCSAWHKKDREIQDIILREVSRGINSSDIRVNLETVMDVIRCVPVGEKQKLVGVVCQKVLEGLKNPDINIQKIATKMIPYTSYDDNLHTEYRMLLLNNVRSGIKSKDEKIRRIAISMLCDIPAKDRAILIQELIQTGRGHELVSSSLYDKNSVDGDHFKREEFIKTGSETTLLGGALKGKTIIRHINPESFLVWQRLFEDYKLWKDNGFDYIPLEPIQSFKLNQESSLVDVYAGVLDLNLHVWGKMTDMFQVELEEQRKKILSILNGVGGLRYADKGIEHAHKQNFCLRFFRDDDGGIDFNRTPRLYLIDFDQALFV